MLFRSNWIQYSILAVVIIAILLFSYGGEKIVNTGISESDFNTAISKINADKNLEIQNLNKEIEGLKNIPLDNTSVEEEKPSLIAYLIDELFIGYSINEELTDREIVL